MKTIFQFVSAAAFVFAVASCETGSADVDQEYNDLQTEHDSLVKVSQNLQDSLHAHRSQHQSLMQRLETRDSVDTTHLENMAKHEAMLKQLEATVAEHDKLRQGHEELKQNKDDLSDQELKSQMDQMKSHHDQMMSDHSQMRDKLGTMRDEHRSIMQNLRETEQQNDTTGTR